MAGLLGVAAALLAAWLAAFPAAAFTDGDFLLPHDHELPLVLEPELKLGFEAEDFAGEEDFDPPNHELPPDFDAEPPLCFEPEPKLDLPPPNDDDFDPELKLDRLPLLNEDREPELNDRPPPPDPPFA